jgi:hypothetical protein
MTFLQSFRAIHNPPLCFLCTEFPNTSYVNIFYATFSEATITEANRTYRRDALRTGVGMAVW